METKSIKTNFIAKLSLNRAGLLIATVAFLSCIGVGNMYGSDEKKTYYAVAGAKSSTGNGTVYVGTSAAGSSTTHSSEMAYCGSKEVKWDKYIGQDPGKGTITFYFSAKPEGDKLFLGWKANQSDVGYTGEAQSFSIPFDGTRDQTVSNPTFSGADLKRYAYFGDGLITPSTLIYAFDKSGNGTFDVTYISGKTITLTSSNTNFEVSPSSISAGNRSQTITITYKGSAPGIDRTLIKIASPGLETQYVDVSAVAGTINSSNANTFTFETGTVNSSTAFPYHKKESLGVTECFAGSTPAFDELYLFGTTLRRTDHAEASIAIGNAVTPCYVYKKSGSSYVYSKVVNMNSDTKEIGVGVTANGQKLYFSGWCPYASAGYKVEDIGVFHITGAANKTVDIYLSNAYISTRTKFNGHATTDYEYTISVSALDIIDPNFWVKGGSGGVFVFQTSSTNSSQPFKPSIHVKNSNYLKSNQGNFVRVIVSLLSYNQPANQCSAPIHMYTTSGSQYETLTIDDVWPTASGPQRTNGALQFAKAVNQSPSIDLGNENSVVNLNGGRITFANAIPGSTSYTNTFAISCRLFEKDPAKLYGIGGDRIDGTINFNDGTIDVTPLSDKDYSSYSTLYHDNKSIKVPITASINGGSHNCAIWKCSTSTEKGSSPTDKSGTALCKLTIPETSANANGISSFEIPEIFRPGLEAYYAEKGWTYGSSSVSADADGNVHLMLPCDKINEDAIISVQNTPWVAILPEFTAEAAGFSQDMGGDALIVSNNTHETNRLLYGRIGDYIPSALSDYTDPKYGVDVVLKSNDKNKNALNDDSYLISLNSYILLPIVADQWFTFAAPFDVTKVSIFDAYPDALATAQTNEEALISQAKSNLDLFCYIADGIDNGSQMDIESLVGSWVTCEKEVRYPDEEDAIKNQFKKREINPYASASAASDKKHFWLYENANEWTYDGKNFSGQTLITGKTDGILMQKNKVYSLMFSSENVATGDWKYWTGKYILIEGGENCEIAGKNSQPSTSESYTSANSAAIKGNHTLADIAAPASLGAFWGYDYSTGTYKHQTSKTNPTQAFLYTAATPNDGTPAVLSEIVANGLCKYTIAYNSSNITVIAAPEVATYALENNAGIKYFYSNSVWKQLTYDEASNPLYLCDDSHYYGYNETSQKWELAEYTITYKDKDNAAFSGTHADGYPTSHTYGTATTLVDPTKEGYTFEGWFDNSTCTGDRLTSLGAMAYTTGITLYAKWTEKSYAVTFNNGGHGTVQVAGAEVADGATASVNHFTTKPLSATASTGYTFAGWSTTGSVTLGSTSDASTNITATAAGESVTATWTANNYSITYDLAGGSVTTANPTSYTVESAAITLNNPTKSGYTFDGWTGTGLSDATATVTIAAGSTGDRSYTATWHIASTDVLEVKKDEQITINSNETVTTTIVHADGKLDVSAGTLSTTDLILEASENASGQIIGADKITLTPSIGNAYFDLSHEGGFKARTWYAVAVPWKVFVPTGALGGVYLKKGELEPVQQTLGTTFDLIFYDGERRATTGENKAWTYVEDYHAAHTEKYPVMEPGVAYMIYLTSDADVIRFKMTIAPQANAKLHTNNTEVFTYESPNDITTDENWNGIANPATYHAYLTNVGVAIGQVYIDPIKKRYATFDMSKKLVVGQPVFVQAPVRGTVYVPEPTPSSAPRRAKEQVSPTRYDLMLAASDADVTDRVIVFMDENKTENEYVIGKDLVKMGVSDMVPQMWIDRYEKKMCVNTVAGFDNTADYPLSIFAPKNGDYDLFIDDQPNDETMLYLTYDGEAIWNLSYGGYVASLDKGTNTHYGLRIAKKAPQITTGIEETTIQNGEAVRKVLVNDKVYIIRNGEIYSVTGQKAK